MKCYRILGRTETGPVRISNQDHILVADQILNDGKTDLFIRSWEDFPAKHGCILAVADGVGGEAGGQTASRMTLDFLKRLFYRPDAAIYDEEMLTEILYSASRQANESILYEGLVQPKFKRMGSTLTGVCLHMDWFLIYNAGDSRVYLERNNKLVQLTTDDTLTARAVRMGEMDPQKAKTAKERHTLTNCLGSPNFRFAVMRGPELHIADRLLICSDGLHDMVPEEELAVIMRSGLPLESLMNELYRSAYAHGGNDNTSVILVDVMEQATDLGDWEIEEED